MRFAIALSGGKLSEKHWRSENHVESRTEVWINDFVCGYKFGNEEYPYLALIKNYKNQFICEKCAEKVNPDRVRSETGNDEKTV